MGAGSPAPANATISAANTDIAIDASSFISTHSLRRCTPGVKLRMGKSMLLAGKIDAVRMSSGSRPVEAVALMIRELFQKSGAHSYGLTEADFQCILEHVAGKYVPGAPVEHRMQFWRDLKLEELALARACAAGHEK